MNRNCRLTLLCCSIAIALLLPLPVVGAAQPTVPADAGFSIEPADVEPTLFFGPPPEASEHYHLGPEDVLDIRVFELEQFNRTVRVSGDGSINVPLIGRLMVGGMLPEEAAVELAERLQEEYVQDPQVSIFVQEFNSRRFSMLGAVQRPATYPLLGQKSLLQALADAGGVTEEAANALYVFRQTADGRRARLAVSLKALLQGEPRLDVWLVPGDVVSVPPKEFIRVSVLGAVEKPGIYELLQEEASLLKALASAEGLNVRASKNGIEIQRVDASGEEVILKIRLGDILSGKITDPPLLEGDIVYVNERFF